MSVSVRMLSVGIGAVGGKADLALSMTVLALWSAWAIFRMTGIPALDLTALYMAGRLWADGLPNLVYAVPEGFFRASPPQWQAHIQTYGMGNMSVTPFVYPPVWVPLLGALSSRIEIGPWFEAWRLVLVPLLAACVPLAWRLVRPGFSMLAAAILAVGFFEISHIPRFALSLGQPQILVTFLTLLAFERRAAGWSFMAGVLLALAASIKLMPAIFVLVFVIDRDWRGLAAFVIAGAALGAVSLLVAEGEMHRDFVAALAEMHKATLISVYNPSFKALLGAIQYPEDVAAPLAKLVPLSGWVHLAGRALFLTGLLLWARGALRLRDGSRDAKALMSLSVLVIVFGPLGWLHYYLLPALLMPVLTGGISRMRAMGLYVLLLLATSSWLVAGIMPTIRFGAIAYQAVFIGAALCLARAALARSRQQFAPNTPHSGD